MECLARRGVNFAVREVGCRRALLGAAQIEPAAVGQPRGAGKAPSGAGEVPSGTAAAARPRRLQCGTLRGWRGAGAHAPAGAQHPLICVYAAVVPLLSPCFLGLSSFTNPITASVKTCAYRAFSKAECRLGGASSIGLRGGGVLAAGLRRWPSHTNAKQHVALGNRGSVRHGREAARRHGSPRVACLAEAGRRKVARAVHSRCRGREPLHRWYVVPVGSSHTHGAGLRRGTPRRCSIVSPSHGQPSGFQPLGLLGACPASPVGPPISLQLLSPLF